MLILQRVHGSALYNRVHPSETMLQSIGRHLGIEGFVPNRGMIHSGGRWIMAGPVPWIVACGS